MEFVSTSSSYLGLKGYQIVPSGKKETVWCRSEVGGYLLKALPIAEKGSETRYRVFSPDTVLTLVESGNECHVAVWEASQEPVAILRGFWQEMQDIPKLEKLSGQTLGDNDAWLDRLTLA